MERWKELIQYATAVAAFISGVTLSFIQYFESGDLTNGVLGYVAQVLVYAASIFGVTMYWNGKYQETMNVVRNLENRLRNDGYNTNVVGSKSK